MCAIQAFGARMSKKSQPLWVQTLTDPAAGHFLFVARIAEVEMTAAIARRRRFGSLTPAQAGAALAAFRQDFAQQYRIMEIAIPVLQEASQLADRRVLRAYDAVQLRRCRRVECPMDRGRHRHHRPRFRRPGIEHRHPGRRVDCR
jgi:predicted nucleic acid-binding protein